MCIIKHTTKKKISVPRKGKPPKVNLKKKKIVTRTKMVPYVHIHKGLVNILATLNL